MSIVRSSSFVLQFHGTDGLPLAGGYLCTYLAGTTTPEATYADAEGTRNPVEIPLDSKGECTVYLDSAKSYKFITKDSSKVQVNVYDQVTARCQVMVGSDTIEIAQTEAQGIITCTFSVKSNSIGKSQLKNARDLVVDEDQLKIELVDDVAVLSLADSLVTKLNAAGIDI